MSRHRRCPNFAWRDNDPAYLAERRNDALVFRKIKREAKRSGLSPLAVLRRISASPLWSARLKGKSLPSWKRAYNKRRRPAPRPC